MKEAKVEESLQSECDGTLDKISIVELFDSTRLLLVEINKNNRLHIIASNTEIIGCKTCGYQSGNAFVNLVKTSKGFILYMEYGQVSFFYESDGIYLDKINLSIIKQTLGGIEEKHELFLHQKFGKINLSDLKEGYILKIKNQYQSSDLITDSIGIKSNEEINDIHDHQLLHLFHSNGGIHAFYKDGTVTGCPQCDLNGSNIESLKSKESFATYTSEENAVCILYEDGSKTEIQFYVDGKMSEDWVIKDDEWLIPI